MGARLVNVFHVRLKLQDGAITGPHPLAALNRDAGTPRVLRDDKAGAQEHDHAPLPPRAEKSDDSPIVVRPDGRMVVEDRGREQQVRTDAGVNGSPAKPRNRGSKPDESLSVGTIAATMAAVIVVSFGFTALLPSLLTRDGVESTATLTTPPAPVQPPQNEQFGATLPRDPGLAQLPAPVPSAAVSNPESYEAWSLTNLAPVLRASVPPEKQAGGRVTAAEVLAPSAGKGATINLTAAEKAAVTRGLNELKTTAAVTAPRRPAPSRPALTEEEKAAVERGLRELEKTAGQVNP